VDVVLSVGAFDRLGFRRFRSCETQPVWLGLPVLFFAGQGSKIGFFGKKTVCILKDNKDNDRIGLIQMPDCL